MSSDLFSFKIGLFFFALAFAALFSFLETAFTAIRLFKIKELAGKSKRHSLLFDAWEANPRRILITILIASSIAHVLCSVLISDIIQAMLGDTGVALLVGVASATIIILIFGEIIPKNYAKLHYERIVISTLWVINVIFYLFYPVVSVLLSLSDRLMRKMGHGEGAKGTDIVSEKEIEFLIDYGDEKGVIETEKSEMLQNIFSLAQTLAKEVMVPEVDMVMIEIGDSLENALGLFTKSRFTRLPVYEGKEDNIVGILHQKDVLEVLYQKQQKAIRELVMPILFVPETKKINQLLSEFLKKHVHMAIVIDEHGNILGLITLEDVLEEIVGEISDEREQISNKVVPLEQGGWLVDARVELEKLEIVLKISFDTEESVTLAGFLSEQLGHLPKKGERVAYRGYTFQVQRSTLTRVYQVLVFKDKEGEAAL
jgi:putative hemolysin